MSLPRVLTIMGSGETAPTMVKVHRAVVDRLGPAAGPGILLDTPFGFQLNAPELAARAVAYFRDSVGAELQVAGMRRAEDLVGPAGAEIAARLSAAPLVFAGPGSPTYALRHWRATVVPGLLAEKLALGGAVTFASAAALTLGRWTVPVYEIYKAGEPPRWEEGLDVLGGLDLGLAVAVIPHFDNAEGGTHDTRYCYLGEPRLAQLEQELPDGAFVLGIDEHTALVLDLGAGTAAVSGLGQVTVRVKGRSAALPAGTEVPIARLVELAGELARTPAAATPTGGGPRGGAGGGGPGGQVPAAAGAAPRTATTAGHVDAAPVDSPRTEPAAAGAGSPLLQAIRRHEAAFRAARAAADVDGMVATVIALDEELWSWQADTLQSDEMDRGHAALRGMVAELGRLAALGARDPATVVGPFVDVALAVRDEARRARRFAQADEIRTRLAALGVEVHDAPDGSTWELRVPPGTEQAAWTTAPPPHTSPRPAGGERGPT